MIDGKVIVVIIPALNEARSIGAVIESIPGWVDDVIVVDNGSSDGTGDIAHSLGAEVVQEPKRGYGRACLSGISAASQADVIVFLDADFSDDATQMLALVKSITADEADLVLGQRLPHARQALTPQQVFGNRLACLLIKLIWGFPYRDLGPFRAIDRRTLAGLDMRDENYGWTVEMQIKAAEAKLRIKEVDVDYRVRIGRSKISGTVRGVIGAGTKILWTIARYALKRHGSRKREALVQP